MRKATVYSLLKKGIPVGLGLSVFLGYLVFLTMYSGPTLAATNQDKGYKPVVPLEVVMEVVDDLFGDLKDTLEDKKLKDRKKFKQLKINTAFLGEMMNVTAQFDHKEYSKEKGWDELANKTQVLLLEASEVAKKKDGKAFGPYLKKIDAACEACHEKYRDI